MSEQKVVKSGKLWPITVFILLLAIVVLLALNLGFGIGFGKGSGAGNGTKKGQNGNDTSDLAASSLPKDEKTIIRSKLYQFIVSDEKILFRNPAIDKKSIKNYEKDAEEIGWAEFDELLDKAKKEKWEAEVYIDEANTQEQIRWRVEGRKEIWVKTIGRAFAIKDLESSLKNKTNK